MLIDCYNHTFVKQVDALFPHTITFMNASTMSNNVNERHMSNVQQLYETVHTRWWFHCEDDWEFVNDGFIQRSIRVLTETHNDKLYMMIGREPNTFRPFVDESYGWFGGYSVLRINSGPNGAFASYTANPAIIDVDKLKSLVSDFTVFKGEWHVSRTLGRVHKSRVGIFKEHFYKHIGDTRSTMGRNIRRKMKNE
jgi:hypothetical protein